MKLPHDVQELSAAASELYQQAEKLELTGTVRTKDAADRLRLEAQQMLKQAEAALRLINAEALAGRNIDQLKRHGANLAKEVRYSADVLSLMREAGTLSQISRDLDIPDATLEYYTALAIKKHMDKAIRRRMVASWKGLPSTHDDLSPDNEKIKRTMLLGVSRKRIITKFGINETIFRNIEKGLTKSEALQRTVAIRARWRAKHEKVWQLRNAGENVKYIASRTGYSKDHVKAILKGKFELSSDIYRASGAKPEKP